MYKIKSYFIFFVIIIIWIVEKSQKFGLKVILNRRFFFILLQINHKIYEYIAYKNNVCVYYLRYDNRINY